MVTNIFKCTDSWALLGDISAIHSLILSNHSAFDMEFYIDPTAALPSDDLSGHRLQNSENFYGYFPEAGFIFVRNWFKALNKNAYGAVSLETFSWIDLSLPRITGFLTLGSTAFDFETDTGQPFEVTQNGISNTYPGGGSTATPVTGLDDASEITIRLTGANTYFRFRSDSWLSLKLAEIGDISTLKESFGPSASAERLSFLESFECNTDLSKVTDLTFAWLGCSSLTSFPYINTSSVTYFNQTWWGCSSLIWPETLVIDTSKGINFHGCWNKITFTKFPPLDFSSALTITWMLYGCTLNNFEDISFPLATDASKLFFEGVGSTIVKNIDMPEVTNFREMFSYSELTILENINLSSGTDFTHFCSFCSSLTSLPAADFSKGINFSNSWNGCTNLICFDALNFSSLTQGLNTFNNCSSLIQPPSTGTPLRNGDDAAAGTWSNPGACP